MSLVPKHIKNLLPYKAGKPISEVKRELKLDNIVKLASNENPLGPSKVAINKVKDVLTDTHRYPDSNGYDLRLKLSEKFDLDIKNVIIGGGSEGIMSVIMRTFLRSSDEIIATENSFIGFRVLANASGVKVNWVPMKDFHYDLKSMTKKINDYTKPITIPGGFLVIKLDDKKKEEIEIDFNKEFNKQVANEKNSQLQQFSEIFYKKIKKNSVISEK